MPLDVPAGGAGRGDGGAGLDGDPVAIGSDGDIDGLAGVGQAGLDLLPADHDRPAGGDPPGDDQGLGQAGRLDGRGPGSAQPGEGFGRDRAGHGAGQDAASQDVDDGAVEPQGDALPGQSEVPRRGVPTARGRIEGEQDQGSDEHG
jgi:hypothetical protein